MSVLTEIKAFLDSLVSLGPITVGSMPALPNAIGTLYEYGGEMPERKFGVAGIGYEHSAVQLVFRGEPDDYAGPRAQAEIAYLALAAAKPGPLGDGHSGVSTKYLMIQPQQSPHPVAAVDDNKRHRIGINFYIMKEPS